MGKGLDFITDVLNEVNKEFTIGVPVQMVKDITGFDLESKSEPKETPTQIDYYFVCPFDICERCGDCGEDFEEERD